MKKETITIAATKDSPVIVLDGKNLILKIIGASYPENANQTYSVVLEWIEEIEKVLDANNRLRCEFYYNYLNSSSKKMVYEILKRLEDIYIRTELVEVSWFFDEFDEDMEELGQEFDDLLKIPFKFVAQE